MFRQLGIVAIVLSALSTTHIGLAAPVISPVYIVNEASSTTGDGVVSQCNPECVNMVRIGNVLYLTYRRTEDGQCYVRPFDLGKMAFSGPSVQVSDCSEAGYHNEPSITQIGNGAILTFVPWEGQKSEATFGPRCRTMANLYDPSTWSACGGIAPSGTTKEHASDHYDFNGVFDNRSGATYLIGEGTSWCSSEPQVGIHRIFYKVDPAGQFVGPFMLVEADNCQPEQICGTSGSCTGGNIFTKGDLRLGKEASGTRSLHLVWNIRNTFDPQPPDHLFQWNYDLFYAKSVDGGVTWQNLAGTRSVDVMGKREHLLWNDLDFRVYQGDVCQKSERSFDIDRQGRPVIVLMRPRAGTGNWDPQFGHVDAAADAAPAPVYDLVCYRWNGAQWVTSVVDAARDWRDACPRVRVDENDRVWLFVNPNATLGPPEYKVSSDGGQTWSVWSVIPSTMQEYANRIYSYADPVDPNCHYIAWVQHTSYWPDNPAHTLRFVQLKLSTQVVGRHVFYNNSCWDGYTPGPVAQDDKAIATDKVALLPGQTALTPGPGPLPANYISYAKGINGIMIDVQNLPGPGSPTLADFEFTNMGKDFTGQSPAALPNRMSVRRGAGAGGSDRITLVWVDNAIPNTNWLRVRLRAAPRTGLSTDDVFYFGVAVGEGLSPMRGTAAVTATDSLQVRNNPHGATNPASVTDEYDHNRDSLVDATDEKIARSYAINFNKALMLTTAPG